VGRHRWLRNRHAIEKKGKPVPTDQFAQQDPTEQHDVPGSGDSTVEYPGRTDEMDVRPDHGEHSYRGTGRLDGKKTVITGGDSVSGTRPRSRSPVKEPTSSSRISTRRRRTPKKPPDGSREPGARPSRSPLTCANRSDAGSS
jgi:hypothetical protein